jgi:hypothetical protein
MGTVSEILLYYNIENIDINNEPYFIKMINEIRNRLAKIPDKKNKILVVKLQEVSSEDNGMIPKLEHKNL